MFKRTQKNDDGGWLSLSDMMTVLMVLFLIISVTIAVTSTTRLVKMRGVLSYVSNQEDLLCRLGENLYSKFSTEDIQIGAIHLIIFTNPNYEFMKNSSELTKDFERALSIFFLFILKPLMVGIRD